MFTSRKLTLLVIAVVALSGCSEPKKLASQSGTDSEVRTRLISNALDSVQAARDAIALVEEILKDRTPEEIAAYLATSAALPNFLADVKAALPYVNEADRAKLESLIARLGTRKFGITAGGEPPSDFTGVLTWLGIEEYKTVINDIIHIIIIVFTPAPICTKWITIGNRICGRVSVCIAGAVSACKPPGARTGVDEMEACMRAIQGLTCVNCADLNPAVPFAAVGMPLTFTHAQETATDKFCEKAPKVQCTDDAGVIKDVPTGACF